MISLFALPSYVGTSYSKKQKDLLTRRVSSRIRAEEVASYLGYKLNPTEGYENDVCIHVKPKTLAEVPDGHYIDFLDGGDYVMGLDKRPKVKIIAASICSFHYLQTLYPNHGVYFVPSHHLNLDRVKRERKEVTVGGYIGVSHMETIELYKGVAEILKEVGFDFKTCFDFKTRQDAVDFYKSIDIFVYAEWVGGDGVFKIPTKMVNAMSFGVPSISISPAPLQGNKEIEDYYVRAEDIEAMLKEIHKFKDESYYKEWSEKIRDFSERYHLDTVKDFYETLR